VPDDVAVVGFDDIPFAALSNPRLTTVSTPTATMGRMAAETLLGAIAAGALPDPVILPVALVVRESSTSTSVVPSEVAPGVVSATFRTPLVPAGRG
jgi:DNA-binding LacI/PurR family transcriptional regulator